MVTIGIAPTSGDPRLKHFVVASVHHTLIDGEMFRKGAVTTVLLGTQSMERAWFYGLRLVAHYVDLRHQVVVQVLSTRASEAWVHGKHGEVFPDLINLVTHDQRCRIKPLSLNQAQVREHCQSPRPGCNQSGQGLFTGHCDYSMTCCKVFWKGYF